MDELQDIKTALELLDEANSEDIYVALITYIDDPADIILKLKTICLWWDNNKYK